MNRSGPGAGSASMVLIFAVLCLTVFSLISLMSANSGKAIADSSAQMVKQYYEADTMAECIISDILDGDIEATLGVDVASYWQDGIDYIEFSCPMSEKKELFVKAAIYEDSCDIIIWRIRDIGEWEIDNGIEVWTGDEDEDTPVWMR